MHVLDQLNVWNLLLNVTAIGALLWLGPRAFKIAVLRAQLAAKDQVIATHEQTEDSMRGRMDELDRVVGALREDCQATRAEASLWRGRYEEQSRYTAEGALHEVKQLQAETTAVMQRYNDALLVQLGRLDDHAAREIQLLEQLAPLLERIAVRDSADTRS